MNTTGYPNYSGIGPDNFTKTRLLSLIKYQIKNGRKARQSFKNTTEDQFTRTTLVNEAKRLKGLMPWSYFYGLV